MYLICSNHCEHPMFLGDTEGSFTLENVQGLFSSHVMLQNEHDAFAWALGDGITTQHWTALPCGTWPLGGLFAPCFISKFLWETQQSNWAPGRGTSPSSEEAVPWIKVFFWTKTREEARENHLNQCQGAQEEKKFSPLLHSCILNNLTWILHQSPGKPGKWFSEQETLEQQFEQAL